MTRRFAIAVICIGLASPALSLSDAGKTACTEESLKLCKSVVHDEAKRQQCIEAHANKLSKDCAAAMRADKVANNKFRTDAQASTAAAPPDAQIRAVPTTPAATDSATVKPLAATTADSADAGTPAVTANAKAAQPSESDDTSNPSVIMTRALARGLLLSFMCNYQLNQPLWTSTMLEAGKVLGKDKFTDILESAKVEEADLIRAAHNNCTKEFAQFDKSGSAIPDLLSK